MGGMIGQTLAIECPDRLSSLALVNTTPKYSDDQRNQWKERAASILADGIEQIYHDLICRWFTDQALKNGIHSVRYFANVFRSFDQRSFASVTAAKCELDTLQHLGNIPLPTLVVAAPVDPGVPRAVSELLAASIPKASLEWLQPARHLASLEHVERFDQMLAAHLRAAKADSS